MMLASGVKVGVDEIVPIIIDPDTSNADLTRTVSLLNKYSAIRSNLQFSTGNYNTAAKSNRFGTQDKPNKNVIRTWATTQEKSIQRISRPK